MSTQPRTPEQVRASIEANRNELSRSLMSLRSEVVAVADWRAHINRHRPQVIAGAVVAGFVVGGGIAAILGRKRRRH